MPLRALLFDVDGTLADTEEAHRRAFNEAFAAAGLPWRWDAPLYRDLLKVGGGKNRLFHYARASDPAQASAPGFDGLMARVHADKTARYQARLAAGEIPLRPGVARLIGEARTTGLGLAVVTTTSGGNVTGLLAATLGTEAVDWFAVQGVGESVAAKKPAPDVYLYVLDRLGLPATDCLAIEDSTIGLAAARAAGVPCLVTVSPWTEGDDFSGALAVISDLGEPGRPFRRIAGETFGRTWVDVELLGRWHAAAAS